MSFVPRSSAAGGLWQGCCWYQWMVQAWCACRGTVAFRNRWLLFHLGLLFGFFCGFFKGLRLSRTRYAARCVFRAADFDMHVATQACALFVLLEITHNIIPRMLLLCPTTIPD